MQIAKALSGVAAVMLALPAAFGVGVSAALPASSIQAGAPPAPQPPGRLVEVGGRRLHLYCTGKGSPTVVLVAGGDAFSIDWALVQPRVAGQTRVCSYDRAGLAWSDPGPADETVEQTVGDLHALLRAAGERGPYLSAPAISLNNYSRRILHSPNVDAR
jgi:hypothetical protein